MSHVIAHPFSLTPSGEVRTVEQGTEEEADQTLRVIVSTILGERPMEEMFGIPDPAFLGLNISDVQTVLNDYGFTDIDVTDVETFAPTENTQQAHLTWTLNQDGIDVETDDDEGDSYE